MSEQRLVNLNLRAREKLLSVLDSRTVNVPKPAQAQRPSPRQQPLKPKKRSGFWMFIYAVIILALIARIFVFQIFQVQSSSMEPSLKAGDRIMLNKISLGIVNPFWGASTTKKFFGTIKNPFYMKHVPVSRRRYIVKFGSQLSHGSVIVFKYLGIRSTEKTDQDVFVKRVIALPGEMVELQHGVVFVNYHKIREKYSHKKDRSNFGPYKVPANSYFVLGDNRPESFDSRSFGAVSANDIIGVMAMKISKAKSFRR
jgi:signal peptidase I